MSIALSATLAMHASRVRADETFMLHPSSCNPIAWAARVAAPLRLVCEHEEPLDEGELGEDATETALAKLVDPTCGDTRHAFENSTVGSNVSLVSDWLLSVNKTGLVGTDLSSEAAIINAAADATLGALLLGGVVSPALAAATFLLTDGGEVCDETRGDYDMGLTGLLRVLYLYGPKSSGPLPSSVLDRKAYDHALDDLLTQRGDRGQRRDQPSLCGITLPIQETENHLWMTESSRYLTNQLLRDRDNPLHDPVIDQKSNYAYVNEANGMRQAMLEGLAGLLGNDFHEYNSVPYARLMSKALENLHDFAEDRSVRRGARMVLDFLAGKFASSSSQLRRSVPFRRLPEHEADTGLLAGRADEATWRFTQLVGSSKLLQDDLGGVMPGRAAGAMVVTSTSKYRVPWQIEDLIRDQTGKQTYFQTFRHGGYELYVAGPSWLISAGGVYRPGVELSGGSRIGIDAAVSAITGNPILGPLLGETAVADMVEGLAAKNEASAVATTLMPLAHQVDRTHLIRIEGSANREARNNTCVHPHNFACGLNPVLPDSSIIPEHAIRRVAQGRGEFSFVDLGDSERYYVVFWSAACDNLRCAADAGGNNPSYGFFEVVQKNQDITMEMVIVNTLRDNEGRDFRSQERNAYASFNGPEITFEPDAPVDLWGIHNLGERDMTQWRPARGLLVNNLYPTNEHGDRWRRNCVEIDNWRKLSRIVLDFSDVLDPRWCEVDLKEFVRVGCSRERCAFSDRD